jgi:hypothetical protein
MIDTYQADNVQIPQDCTKSGKSDYGTKTTLFFLDHILKRVEICTPTFHKVSKCNVCNFTSPCVELPCYMGTLLPRHMFLGCEWRRWQLQIY